MTDDNDLVTLRAENVRLRAEVEGLKRLVGNTGPAAPVIINVAYPRQPRDLFGPSYGSTQGA